MDVVLTLGRVSELTPDELAARRTLSLAVYPPDEDQAWSGRHLEWATPEWCARVINSCGELVSYTGIVLRQGTYDGQSVWIGGIGGVQTHPAARGRGYAKLGIERAREFFRAQSEVAFALLVCRPELIEYYGGLGWREFRGQLLVRQYGQVSEFTFNRVMSYGVRAAGPSVGVIDLSGPPW